MRNEHDSSRLLAGLIGESSSEEGLACAGDTDEERIDAFIEEAQVVEREVASADLLSIAVEAEIERIDGVDLGKARVADAAIDRATQAAGLFLVGEAVGDLQRREVFGARALDDVFEATGDAGQSQPAELLNHEVEQVIVFHRSLAGGSPGSRVSTGRS